MITFEEVDSWLKYDELTGTLTWRVSRGSKKKHSIAGYLRSDGYWTIRLNGRLEQSHRIAWLISTGRLPGFEIDHINGNPSDNRLVNLREATHAENSLNKAMRRNNTSGINGVGWHKRIQKWSAYLSINGHRRHLGYFITIEEAAACVHGAREVHHGTFANHGVFLA